MSVAFIFVAYDSFNQKSYCTHDIFSKIRTAHFKIHIVHIFPLPQKHAILSTG